MCQAVLNSRIRSQTKSLWTRPWAATPRHASPNHHVWSALFWDITQSRVAIPYRCFRTTYQSQIQGVKKFKREKMTWLKLTETILFFGTLSII